jgi:hypothetical protein
MDPPGAVWRGGATLQETLDFGSHATSFLKECLSDPMEEDMAVKLNKTGFDHAKKSVDEDHFVRDERDAWSEHQPSTQEENEFIEEHGFQEYAKWHLGIDDEQPEDSKKRCKFPYGDFVDVHRCAVLSAESRAGQYKHFDIETAAARLHGMIDEKKQKARGRSTGV